MTTSGARERGNRFREETRQANPSESQAAWIVSAREKGRRTWAESGERVGLEGELDSRNRNKLLRVLGILVILLLPTAKWMKNRVRNIHQ